MKKYTVDYSGLGPIKGITILFDYIEEGLDYAQQNSIQQVCVTTDDDDKMIVVNFDFLKDRNFITAFHSLIPLAKKSDITGLYNLSNLEDFRWWTGKNDITIDLSNFPKLKSLNIGAYPGVTGWENLKMLNRLMIGGVSSEDLSFLSKTDNLEYLRIIRGKFTTIKGLEKCDNLKTVFIQSCNSLIHIKETIQQMKGIENLVLEKCKNVDLEGIELLGLKNISVI